MESRIWLVVPISLVFLMSYHIVFGIQCYQCNSYDDPGCADFFNNQTYSVLACPEDAKYCRKVVQQAYYEGAWHMRFIRQCAKEGELDANNPNQDWNCYDKIGTYRVKVKYCHCKVDGCNTASSVSISKLLTLSPACLLLFTYVVTGKYFPV